MNLDPSKLYIPDAIKNINAEVFNLVSRTNETKHIKWHETCKCKCRLQWFHTILRLFSVLPNFPFTTSETICDYYL